MVGLALPALLCATACARPDSHPPPNSPLRPRQFPAGRGLLLPSRLLPAQPASDADLCARLVSSWSRAVLDGDTYGDYQSMGLSHGQYEILRGRRGRRAGRERAPRSKSGRPVDRPSGTPRVYRALPARDPERRSLGMSGIGPPEPGGGTRAWDGPRQKGHAGRTRAALADRCARHRRTALSLAAAAVLLGGGALYATRPHPPAPHAAPAPAGAVPGPCGGRDLPRRPARPGGRPTAQFQPHRPAERGLGAAGHRDPRDPAPYAALSLVTEPPARSGPRPIRPARSQ
ncbi:hypothetical protein LT493_01245 [Streptomyces tricolor]|nr:hypothetical protein [Streptomyces tricolor]